MALPIKNEKSAKSAHVKTKPEVETSYQVFVSSTFRDLQEERQKVLQAILEVQAFPAGMELFPAADAEQFEFGADERT